VRHGCIGRRNPHQLFQQQSTVTLLEALLLLCTPDSQEGMEILLQIFLPNRHKRCLPTSQVNCMMRRVVAASLSSLHRSRWLLLVAMGCC
jgi:hypothetical protein